MDLKASIRAIPDHPKPGIVFRDLTTLMGNPEAFAHTCGAMAEAFKSRGVTHVAGIEARGFIFGAAVADRLGCAFVPVRKAGKLPSETLRRSYALEYGEDTLEIHKDALPAGAKVLLLDDLLATGGTARATAELIREAGGEVLSAAFVVELEGLPGRAKLEELSLDVWSLTQFKED
ncbi:adenine phosphoribosyltransferase [Parvularcula maris]|uniref:Adenine phosphoribosyltransferase n=1 Tax=Parvularcula maris TaxID=2965077 RepID=A0A9X2L9T8_9PROT|nr:adenine phosphoribosyltransferase [Parvularcula maris]MCQ8185682.1 adenine phosphoribosyltransferase [Parvularcula maris]